MNAFVFSITVLALGCVIKFLLLKYSKRYKEFYKKSDGFLKRYEYILIALLAIICIISVLW